MMRGMQHTSQKTPMVACSCEANARAVFKSPWRTGSMRRRVAPCLSGCSRSSQGAEMASTAFEPNPAHDLRRHPCFGPSLATLGTSSKKGTRPPALARAMR